MSWCCESDLPDSFTQPVGKLMRSLSWVEKPLQVYKSSHFDLLLLDMTSPTVWWLMWSLPRRPAPHESLQCHGCLKDVKKISWPDMWVKVFIVSSEDGEKTIVVVMYKMLNLIRIMNRGGMNQDRTTSDQSKLMTSMSFIPQCHYV